MTLPITTILPIHSERIKEGGDSLDKYFRELIFSLQRQYEDVAQAVNGDVRRSVDSGNTQFVPKIRDSADDTTTFNYNHQIAYVLRQGISVDYWFDVEWISVSSGTTGGNMYVDLPYKVAIIAQKPFVGVLQSSVFTYTAGTECVINLQPLINRPPPPLI